MSSPDESSDSDDAYDAEELRNKVMAQTIMSRFVQSSLNLKHELSKILTPEELENILLGLDSMEQMFSKALLNNYFVFENDVRTQEGTLRTEWLSENSERLAQASAHVPTIVRTIPQATLQTIQTIQQAQPAQLLATQPPATPVVQATQPPATPVVQAITPELTDEQLNDKFSDKLDALQTASAAASETMKNILIVSCSSLGSTIARRVHKSFVGPNTPLKELTVVLQQALAATEATREIATTRKIILKTKAQRNLATAYRLPCHIDVMSTGANVQDGLSRNLNTSSEATAANAAYDKAKALQKEAKDALKYESINGTDVLLTSRYDAAVSKLRLLPTGRSTLSALLLSMVTQVNVLHVLQLLRFEWVISPALLAAGRFKKFLDPNTAAIDTY